MCIIPSNPHGRVVSLPPLRARLSSGAFRWWTRGTWSPAGQGLGRTGLGGTWGEPVGATEAGIWSSWLQAHPGASCAFPPETAWRRMGHSPSWWDRPPWTGSWPVLREREEAGSRRGDLVTAPERVGEALSGRWRVAPWAGGGGAGDAARVEMALGFGFVWCRFSVFMPPTLTAEPNIPPDIHPGTQVQGLYARTELSETMLVMNLLKNNM